MKKMLLAMAAIGLVSACSEQVVAPVKTIKPAPEKAIYYNAKIYTQDPQSPWAEAIVTKGNRIHFVGSTKQAKEMAGNGSKIYDLNQQFVIPGFVDGHTHPGLVAMLGGGEEEVEAGPDLSAMGKEELLDYLKAYSKENRWEPVVSLGSWDVAAFMPNGPTKEELDEAFSLRPAMVFDNSGHSLWLNSSMLSLLGVDKDTPDINENISYFVRDENGEPTGWVKEFALFPYLGDMLIPERDVLKTGLVKQLNFMADRGVTTLWDGGNFDWDDAIYEVLSELDRANQLPLRYEGSYHIWDAKQLGTAIAELQTLKEKYEGKFLKFNTIKIHYDGVAEIGTAAMLEPYATDPNNRGGLLFERDKLAELLLALEKESIDLHIHTVGDWATREALDAVEKTQATLNKPLSIEVTLSHLETVHSNDIKRFEPLNVHANFTPHWFTGNAFGAAGEINLGEERAALSQQANSFIQAGANTTLSSDVVTGDEAYRSDPFLGLQMSITRQEYNAPANTPVMLPVAEKLTLTDALSAYTINVAKQLGQEDQIGSLAVGKLADFVIVDKSLFEIDVRDIHKVTVNAVIMDGSLIKGAL